MFVLPMLGKSKRFFDAGYDMPKYKLDLTGLPVFSRVLMSFEKYFQTDQFTFIVRQDSQDCEWVKRQAAGLGILKYDVYEILGDTSGQAESVYRVTKNTDSQDDELFIFNIDTILTGFTKLYKNCDGYLELFKADGHHWSFAEVDQDDNVIRTAEKYRISDNCSNGLYFFRNIRMFNNYYESYKHIYKNETYIAPLYNLLISDGLTIKAKHIEASSVLLCGNPQEYESLKKKL